MLLLRNDIFIAPLLNNSMQVEMRSSRNTSLISDARLSHYSRQIGGIFKPQKKIFKCGLTAIQIFTFLNSWNHELCICTSNATYNFIGYRSLKEKNKGHNEPANNLQTVEIRAYFLPFKRLSSEILKLYNCQNRKAQCLTKVTCFFHPTRQ